MNCYVVTRATAASDRSTDSGSSSDDGSSDSESSGSDSDDGEPRARAVKPGNVDPRKLNRDALTGALKKLNLRTFAKKLRAEGIDDLETITHYSVEELRKVGFTAEQANRLHAHALLHEAEVQEQRLKAIGEIDIFLSHNWGTMATPTLFIYCFMDLLTLFPAVHPPPPPHTP